MTPTEISDSHGKEAVCDGRGGLFFDGSLRPYIDKPDQPLTIDRMANRGHAICKDKQGKTVNVPPKNLTLKP